MPIIQVKELTKVFGKNTKQALELLQEGETKAGILEKTGQTVGVNRATFSVNEGEIFVIMGLSGSGKSTLIRLLNRLIEPTQGNILFQNEDISQMNKKELREIRRHKLGMVFQHFALFPHRTILENVSYGLEVQDIPKEERLEKAKESLEMVGLGSYIDQYPDQLSGGMQQRVGIARALANDPEVLLMDEAFSALDPLIRKEMQDELIALQSSMQKTIIFITHDLNEALRIGDRIALMRDGAIVQVGSPEEILIEPANDYVEKFVEDVDRSKILTAGHIMKRPETVNLDRHGPRVALERMREEGLSGVYVVDQKRTLQGYVTAEAAAKAVREENSDLRSILINDLPVVEEEVSMQEIFDLIHDSPMPVAVTKENVLVGIIVRGAVIAALSKDGEVNNTNDE